jgi:hypothetical protein
MKKLYGIINALSCVNFENFYYIFSVFENYPIVPYSQPIKSKMPWLYFFDIQSWVISSQKKNLIQ